MNQLTIATSEADAAAAEVFERHHAQLIGQLSMRAETLVALTRDGRSDQAETARIDLVAWARAELLPHARAEEDTLYGVAAADPQARLLVAAMLAEHKVITDLVDRLSVAKDALDAAATASRLSAIVESHVAKENDQLLQFLIGSPEASVAELLAGMHELLQSPGSHDVEGREESHAESDAAGHTCSCGEAGGDGHPELDARTIPHAIRHATIFGALDSVRPGHGLVLVAPHDPLPLLAQIEERSPRAFTVDYLERGPEKWRLSFVRGTA